MSSLKKTRLSLRCFAKNIKLKWTIKGAVALITDSKWATCRTKKLRMKKDTPHINLPREGRIIGQLAQLPEAHGQAPKRQIAI